MRIHPVRGGSAMAQSLREPLLRLQNEARSPPPGNSVSFNYRINLEMSRRLRDFVLVPLFYCEAATFQAYKTTMVQFVSN